MNKKLIWVIVILLVLIITLVGLKKAGVIGKDEGTKVSAEKAAKRTITETVTASGKIYPEVEVKVSSDVSGEVVELNVDEGDSVKKGEVLAKIYPDIYLSQRDQAVAGVTQSQAQVANSSAALEALKAILDQTEAAYNREKKLLTDKVVSQSEFEQSQQAYLAAKANYLAAQQNIKAGQASVVSAKAILNSADKNVNRTTITASMDGVVSLMEVKKGERVVGTAQMTGTEMMRIADLGSIVTQVDVGENDIPKVHYGDTAIVTVDAFGSRKFKGIVFKIVNPVTSTATTSSTSSTDVTNYKVHIRLLKDSYKDLIVKGQPFPFRPNMSSSADIQTRTNVNVLAVPLNAVTTRDKKDAAPKKKGDKDASADNSTPTTTTLTDDDIDEVVYVVGADNKVKKAKVKTSIQDLNYIQIIDGVKEGDMVVTGPYNLVSKTLKEGDMVKVVPKDQLYDDKKKKD
jgi:HlyD family secretion protein